MYGYNGLCVASCPLGTYPDTTTIPLCMPCPAFCETCDQTGRCITCVVGSYFSPFDNLCHNPCPVLYYGDPVTFVCSSCDSSCLTCHGPTLSDCDSCPPLTFLVYSTCYSTCPPHTYSITCQICDASCLNCTGPSSNNCTSCNELYMLHLNYSQCVSSCFEGDIADNSAMTCLTCPLGKTGYFK
jgi:proprotein convertase subtilisin/kexin type 5